MINIHENLSYFEEAADTDSIISLKVKHPETGEWMNKEELAKVFKAMTEDINVMDVIPNYKDSTNRILEKPCFTG